MVLDSKEGAGLMESAARMDSHSVPFFQVVAEEVAALVFLEPAELEAVAEIYIEYGSLDNYHNSDFGT